jgi:carboxyl-terminal processing protease
MKQFRLLFIFTLFIAAGMTWSFKEDLFQISKNLDIFASLYKEVSINYVDETNPSDLMRTGIDAMLDNLDPYTEYVPESEIEDYKLKYVSTQYGGIGASTVFIDGKLYINDLVEGYPAYKSDLRSGDQLVKIDGAEVKGKDRKDISLLLRGPKGSQVELLMIRDGSVITKKLTRDEIKQPNVKYSGMLADNIGYIRLDKFLENSAQEVKDAAVVLGKSKPAGMILDLRYNGGGILQEAVKIVNLFVNKDVLVVTQKGRNPQKTMAYKTTSQALFPDVPVVVLISGSSASASEIVAGALQDLDRAIVVGQRSYGKGLVQQSFSLPYNSLVKVTVAKYFTPSGRCIQAVDYAHRDENGKTVKFADSSITRFSTKAGRNVYNSNGIYPDVVVEPVKYSEITNSLLSKNLLFDYANSYKRSNKAIAEAGVFQLTDKDYATFLASLSGKDYAYSSNAERLLSDIRTSAEKDGKLALVKKDLELLKEKLVGTPEKELLSNKEEIKRILESQIVGRYYYDRGRIVNGFRYDKDVAAARSVINNAGKMMAILKGEGEYHTIGNPLKLK